LYQEKSGNPESQYASNFTSFADRA
jgi:hypothetical protein